MSLTLTQEQTISSLLHYMLNQTDHHDGALTQSIQAVLQTIDSDIVSQSGTVYSSPLGPGTLDNLAGSGSLEGPPGT